MAFDENIIDKKTVRDIEGEVDEQPIDCSSDWLGVLLEGLPTLKYRFA